MSTVMSTFERFLEISRLAPDRLSSLECFMISRLCLALACFLSLFNLTPVNLTQAAEPAKWWNDHRAEHFELYQWLHSNPELSLLEKNTAAKLAGIWKDAGFKVTTSVGGTGVVAILKNGDGPTVMLRTDLDGLPVTESTPLPFASKMIHQAEDGSKTGVMHACGHDIHMTNLTSVAKFMSANRDQWSGTLILIGQPAEERGMGAKMMLADGTIRAIHEA